MGEGVTRMQNSIIHTIQWTAPSYLLMKKKFHGMEVPKSVNFNDFMFLVLVSQANLMSYVAEVPV